MKKKKRFLQACEIGGSLYGKKRTTSKSGTARRGKIQKKNLVETYNKFYKDQVSALYKAIQKNS